MVNERTSKKDNVYPLRQALVQACDDIEERALAKLAGESEGIKLGIPEIDNHVNPFQAGDLISFLGVTGNYKSGFMEYVFDNAVKEAMQDSTNKCAIHVTWEVTSEMYAMRMLSRASGISVKDMVRGDIKVKEIGGMRITAGLLSAQPIFIIGNSTARGSDGKRSRDKITRAMAEDAIDHIINGNEFKDIETNQNFDPVVMSFDYLQLIPQIGNDARIWNKDSVKWAKDMAFFGGCPVLLGVQAKRDVEDRMVPIPTKSDGQETSAIEQYSDALFSVCIPAAGMSDKKFASTDTIGWLSKHPNLPLTRNLLILALLKQKNNYAGKAWPLNVNFNTNEIVHIGDDVYDY